MCHLPFQLVEIIPGRKYGVSQGRIKSLKCSDHAEMQNNVSVNNKNTASKAASIFKRCLMDGIISRSLDDKTYEYYLTHCSYINVK